MLNAQNFTYFAVKPVNYQFESGILSQTQRWFWSRGHAGQVFNWDALISVDGVWGGMLIWVTAYVNAQLGSLQCQNTSARVSECHQTLAPAQRVDRHDKHTYPHTCDLLLCQYQTFYQSRWTAVSTCNAATHTCHLQIHVIKIHFWRALKGWVKEYFDRFLPPPQ